MTEPVALFLYDDLRRIDLRVASHLWLARRAGWRPIVARWRDVRLLPGATRVTGREVDETLRLGPVRAIAAEPALVVHRKLVWGASQRLFGRLAEAHPNALLSYAPAWRPISWKCTGETCFAAGERAGLHVARPATFLVRGRHIPDELRAFAAARPVIFKPSTGSQCHGVRLATPQTFAAVAARLGPGHYVAQELITDGLLYDGRKIDLRLYALVTSFAPLRFEVLRGGVVRIAGREFDGASPDDSDAALTGNSYRKRRGLSLRNATLDEFLERLSREGGDVDTLWRDVEELMGNVFRCLAAHPSVAVKPQLDRRFYLCGFDLLPVLRDGQVRLLYLETNYVPQLNAWGREADHALRAVHSGWLVRLRELYQERLAS